MINKIALTIPGGYTVNQTTNASHLDDGRPDIFALISWSITMALILASMLCLALLVYGGIRWITSGGDKAGVESARNIIVSALVGLVIVFLSFSIITLIGSWFGINYV